MGSQGMGVRLGASGSWVGFRIACNGRSKNSFRLASWVIECNAHLQKKLIGIQAVWCGLSLSEFFRGDGCADPPYFHIQVECYMIP
jgi:hypothetical protein